VAEEVWTISDELREAFADEPELRELFSELGEEIARTYDVEAALELEEESEKRGMWLTAEQHRVWKEEMITFWKETVESITGKKIDFDESAKRWRDVETGRFVKDPYVIIRTSELDFEEALRKAYLG